jgi:hypothetical protein
MAEIMIKVIEDVGAQKVLGICTDNASNMKKAWEIIEERFPHIQTYGCLAHSLNLIFTDVGKIKSFSRMIADCVAVVKHIKNSQKLSALLKVEQEKSCNSTEEGSTKPQSLKIPVKTRYVLMCISYYWHLSFELITSPYKYINIYIQSYGYSEFTE